MELFKNTNFDFLGKKWPFIIASLVLTAAGLISIAMHGGLRWGIDFRGGALVYVKFDKEPPEERIRRVLSPKLPGGVAEVQEVRGTNEVIIGTEVREERELESARRLIVETLATEFGGSQPGKIDINNSSTDALVSHLREPLQRAGVALSEQQLRESVNAILGFKNTPPRSGLITNLEQLSGVPGVTPQMAGVLKQTLYASPYTVRNIEIVGPKVGGELRNQAILATLYALAGMLVYLAFRFELSYGVAAVIAVFHDTIITLGLFSICGYEITLTVVAALLTLVGYSMNDTIVVFDRIRENLRLTRRENFEALVNASINQTLSRTVLTSGLTLLSCLALLIFGGPVLHGFAFALVAGIIVGTYSSIFVASPILVGWRNMADKRRKGAAAPPPPAAVTSAGAAARRTPAKTVR
jgi:preprotein translocase subunit SecF